jgi:hypothetical protein
MNKVHDMTKTKVRLLEEELEKSLIQNEAGAKTISAQ